MKRIATIRNSDSVNSAYSRAHKYQKVLDNRKQPIRGLWRRAGTYIARLTVEDELGRKSLRWSPLAAATLGEAQNELRTLLVERKENRLRHIGQSPTFADYLDQTFLPHLESMGKRPSTLATDKPNYKRWRNALGHLRLDKIRANHVIQVLNELRKTRSARTCNKALICLRHVLKAAKRDGHLKVLPVEDIPWQKAETKARRLYTLAEIQRICSVAMKVSKNGQQLSDYLHFLAFSGARKQEALTIRWEDVDKEKKLLTIGASGETKNHKARRVNLNSSLERLLEEMASRRAPDSKWLFPSPQRGKKDVPGRSFKESLKQAKTAAELPGFGFHDCRHFFISMCVMAGIDFMTIAKWVGHQDGGVLIGKVYGHLADEHTQRQAEKLILAPLPAGT